MAVCHLTLHAYGTWWPNHQRGYTTKEDGVLPPDETVAERYRESAKFDPVSFDAGMQNVLIAGANDICLRRHWRLHAIGTDKTHLHLLVSHVGYLDFLFVRNKLKNLLSLFMGRYTGVQARPWFAADGSNKQVKDRAHFDYLVNTYLPDHRGVFWKEGQPIPIIPDGIL